MSPPSVSCCGELLVDRSSGGIELPGGAPANVAAIAAALGVECDLISRVGADERGEMLAAWLHHRGVGTGAVATSAPAPTGLVEVSLGRNGPEYDIVVPAAWDFIEGDAATDALARRAKIFVCGTLAQRQPVSRASVRRGAALTKACGGIVFVDLNLRTPFYDEETVLWCLRQADVLKLSDAELAAVSAMLGATGSPEDLLLGLAREFALPRVILTAGSGGAWFVEHGELAHAPAIEVTVVDTVGCGDAVSAVAAVFLAHGHSLREAAPWCMEVAGFVATRSGATPELPEELVRRIRGAVQS